MTTARLYELMDLFEKNPKNPNILLDLFHTNMLLVRETKNSKRLSLAETLLDKLDEAYTLDYMKVHKPKIRWMILDLQKIIAKQKMNYSDDLC